MQTRTFMIACAAMALASGFVLTTSSANAESAAKQCGAKWKASKAAGTTNGQTWKEFYATCKTTVSTERAPKAEHAAAPAAAPAPAMAPAAAMTPAAAMAHKPKKERASSAPAAGAFAAEAEAKGHCPGATVVWVNTHSHKYHYAGNRSYGTTKHGAYMCEADAKSAGNAAAKDEKPK